MVRVFLFACLLAPSICVAQSQKVNYSYDDAGRLAKVDYGNGQTINYTYDKSGNLIGTTSTGVAANAKPGAAAKAKAASQRKAAKPESKEK